MAECLVECNYCRTSSADSRRCARCFSVYHCSKLCQRLDWPSHKQNCNSSKLEAPGQCKMGETGKDATGVCNTCNKDGCTTKCSRCKSTFYCSRKCQAENWSQHKKDCPEQKPRDTNVGSEFTEDEKLFLAYRQEEHNERVRGRDELKEAKTNKKKMVFTLSQSYTGDCGRFYQCLTPEQLAVFERRPPGSLQKAIAYITALLPGRHIIQCFHEVQHEFDREALQATFGHDNRNILVAFMFMYHHHAMRHGVYLKDAKDKILHVEFYLDHLDDDPRPYFTYDQVKPGGYIFITNPARHAFGDGITGFRINHPSEVLLADIKTL